MYLTTLPSEISCGILMIMFNSHPICMSDESTDGTCSQIPAHRPTQPPSHASPLSIFCRSRRQHSPRFCHSSRLLGFRTLGYTQFDLASDDYVSLLPNLTDISMTPSSLLLSASLQFISSSIRKQVKKRRNQSCQANLSYSTVLLPLHNPTQHAD